MLIGLNGKKGAGKDTAFERWKYLYPELNVVRASFFDAAYDIMATTLGVDEQLIRKWKNDPEVKLGSMLEGVGIFGVEFHSLAGEHTPITYRQLLQDFGKHSRRVLGADIWTRTADLEHGGCTKIVTDVRMDEAVQAIKDAGGVNVLIVSPTDDGDTHETEQLLPHSQVDYYLDNTVRGDGFHHLDAGICDIMERIQS